MTPSLPVFNTIRLAHAAIFSDFKLFVDIVWLWMGLSLFSVYAFERLAGGENIVFLRVLAIIPHVVALSAVTSRWSRWIVLGEMPTGRAFFAWGGREWRVLGATLGAGLFFAVPTILVLILAASEQGGLALLALPALAAQFTGIYFWARLSLAPVAAAMDLENPFVISWKLTGGRALRLLALSIGCVLPLFALQILLSYGVAVILGLEESATAGTPQDGVMILIGAVTGFLIMAVVQSAQSLAFAKLKASQAPLDPQA